MPARSVHPFTPHEPTWARRFTHKQAIALAAALEPARHGVSRGGNVCVRCRFTPLAPFREPPALGGGHPRKVAMSDTTRKIVAKMQAQTVIPAGARHGNPGTEELEMQAVYGKDGSANKAWSKYTPSGSLSLKIDNPDAQGFFKPGKEYIVEIREAEPGE